MNLVIEPKRTLPGPERPNTGKKKQKTKNMLKLTKGETAPRPNVKTQLTVQARQKSVATSTPKEQPRKNRRRVGLLSNSDHRRKGTTKNSGQRSTLNRLEHRYARAPVSTGGSFSSGSHARCGRSGHTCGTS